MRQSVEIFANEMEEVLQSKDHLHPNGWGDDSVNDLFESLDNKVDCLYFLVNGIRGNGNINIHNLAVDIANFAMMIADKTRVPEQE